LPLSEEVGRIMKKWILIICGTLVVITIIILIAGLSNLGPVIKKAINTYGPRMTNTEVRLGDVSISIFSGEATLKDFYLGNPEGFKSSHAMCVGSIYVDVDEKSLTRDMIVINKIEVVHPQLTYEKRRGTDNFKAILNNIRRTSSMNKLLNKKSGKESKGRKILIRSFIVRDGEVKSMRAGKNIRVSLPYIHFKDVGKGEGGVSFVEAFKELFSALYKNITSPIITDSLNQELKDLGLDIKTVGSGTKKGLNAFTGSIKGLFDN